MISEPELDGAWETARPAEAAQDDTVRPRGPLRPWWAIAAAVVATSALWAGGLYAFGDRGAEPEVRYAVTDDLCAQFKAPALASALGGFTISDPRKGGRHPALDWASCNHNGNSADGSGGYSVVAMVELHKKADPAPEFALGSLHERAFGDDTQWEEVPGLGEQTLVGSSGLSDGLRLRVRDGGAVFTFELTYFEQGEEALGPRAKSPARPDRETLTAAAVEDARALMAALRTH